ncbi:ATP synthase-coupling factor 6, mitochondrial-like [Sipha flava]|uniref:ATP synthase-coupling factor 6, mitochondrial-like n=1 Tax=Sipha flava TaxID=143950 RepID=A0A8B8F7Y5_9HEMI|nr:ATP synthase-coupling factor 6, mitochondrial-like [Sipha flava]XP_025406868.1 ATP synthase-coupling factor 6, mitochondrial-like [Sipha flava]
MFSFNSLQKLNANGLVSRFVRRNISSSSVLMNNVSDPIQQLFLNKIREYKQTFGSKAFDPSIDKGYKADIEKISKQYNIGPNEDPTKFPTIKFDEVKVDPQV